MERGGGAYAASNRNGEKKLISSFCLGYIFLSPSSSFMFRLFSSISSLSFFYNVMAYTASNVQPISRFE